MGWWPVPHLSRVVLIEGPSAVDAVVWLRQMVVSSPGFLSERARVPAGGGAQQGAAARAFSNDLAGPVAGAAVDDEGAID